MPRDFARGQELTGGSPSDKCRFLFRRHPSPPFCPISNASRCNFALGPSNNSETPDSQVTVYEFPNYTLIWEHKAGLNNGLYNRSWGIEWSGTEGNIILNDEDSAEPLPASRLRAFVVHPRIYHLNRFLPVCSRLPAEAQVLPGPNGAVVPKPIDEANRCNLRHVTPKTLQKALYVGFSESGQPLQVVCFGWSQFPVPEARLAGALDQMGR